MDLSQLIRKIPKTETHLHIEGALPWSFLRELDPRNYGEVPFFRKPSFRYDNFSQFESILIDHALKIFKSADDYFNVASSIFQKAKEQNVRYLETSFHAGMIEFLQLPGEEILNAILSAIPEGLEVRVFLGMSRNAYTDSLGPKLEEAVESWSGLTGIDLHGPEDLPIENWTSPLWQKAAHRGLLLKAHAGEFGPATNIDHAISELNVRRIQHGVAARESDSLMDKILDQGVCLEMCPISNYKLRVVDNWTDHPLGLFLDKGICCTISTDDPLSFNNSLEDEYFACIDKLGLCPEKLIQVAKNGFHVADLSSAERETFIQEIEQVWKEFSNHASGTNF